MQYITREYAPSSTNVIPTSSDKFISGGIKKMLLVSHIDIFWSI